MTTDRQDIDKIRKEIERLIKISKFIDVIFILAICSVPIFVIVLAKLKGVL